MSQQLINHDAALRLFFTEEIYLQGEEGLVLESPEITVSQRNDEHDKLPADELAVVEQTEPVVFKYLGKNQRQVLILVNDAQEDVSTADGRELLRNLLKAIQLTANDFALLNYAAYAGTRHKVLFDFFKPKLVLCFGVSPEELGFPDMQVDTLQQLNDLQLVFSANLALLSADQLRKKTLWGSLKKLKL